MQIVNNLYFNGTCRDAFEFYAEVLGGKITAMIRFGDAPPGMDTTNNDPDHILYAWLEIGDQAIMGCDMPGGNPPAMDGFSVGVHFGEVAEARSLFDKLGDGGSAARPFGVVPWSPGFGMLRDRFGTPWLINTRP